MNELNKSSSELNNQPFKFNNFTDVNLNLTRRFTHQ